MARLTAKVTAEAVSAGTGLTEREASTFLRVLAQCVDADAEEQQLIEHLTTRVFDPRVRTLGAALWLAGIMAADPRHMPSVVVDHIGVGAELSLAALHAATVQASWQRTVDGFTLHAVCEHPALYAALSGVVRRANDARRVLDGIELHQELSGYLPAAFHGTGIRAEINDGEPAFDTPPLQFRLSDDKVRELLMGRQLYGEPDLAIRELYQNALDACRYRRTRRAYHQRTDRAVTAWNGAIVMRQDADESGREYIECTDNGVGMTQEVLMSTFANAGERFVYRPTFRAEQAKWQELDPPLRLIPNSQFGVGVFSYFMIAEEILIATRPVDEEDNVAGHAYNVRIASSGSLFQITSSNDMPGGGTRVRLYLTGEDRISVLRTMRRLLWVAEFAVKVSEANGADDTWHPEQLHYPGTVVEPLKHGDDLWWVQDRGCLVADGIRTNEERYGIVVNLRGPRRPHFTVDRNRLRSWDKEWIDRQLRDSLARLQEWPGLTLSWLWRVAEKTPGIAEAVFSWLVDNDRTITIEGSQAHGRPAPAARVGCLPVDMELLNGEMYLSQDDGSNLWLACWRVGVWRGLLTFVGVEQLPYPIRLGGFPVVRPLDGSAIGGLYEASGRAWSPGRHGHPSVDDLLEAVPDEDETPTVRLRRLRRYAITGIDMSAARLLPPVQHVFKREGWRLEDGVESAELITAIAAWAPPGQPRRRGIGGCLGYASARLQVPLGEVLRRAGALAPSAWVGPDLDGSGDLVDQVFTWNDLAIFSCNPWMGPPWISPTVSPAHIVRLSAKLGRTVTEVLAQFDRYAALGYEVAGRQRYPPELSHLEREALRDAEEMGFALSPLHMLILAGRTGQTVREVRSGLDRLVGAGFLRLPEDDPIPDAAPTDDELAIISASLMLYDHKLGRQVPATGWIAVYFLIRSIGASELAGFSERLARHSRLRQVLDIHRPVTAAEITDVAYLLDYSVSAAIAYYSRLYPDTADLSSLPPGAAASTAECHRFEEREALLTEWDAIFRGQHQIAWTLAAGDIVRGAVAARRTVAAFLESLEPFRALGAPLPVLSRADRAVLADSPVDRYDVAMLREFDGDGRAITIVEIGPLRLIQVAGRFGWTPAEARRRMARLEPLGLTVRCPAEHCPDEIVHWQDLLALTKYLDGQEPALSGLVSQHHLTAAAEDLEETVVEVRVRLEKYAKLFGLTLDPDTAGSEETTVVSCS